MSDWHLDPPDDDDDPVSRICDALESGDIDLGEAADRTGMLNALEALQYDIAVKLAKILEDEQRESLCDLMEDCA